MRRVYTNCAAKSAEKWRSSQLSARPGRNTAPMLYEYDSFGNRCNADQASVPGCICTLEENLLAYDKEVKDWQQYAETLQSHAKAGISESAHKCAHAYAAANWGFPRDMEKAIHYARLAKENMHEGGPVFLMTVYLYAASGQQNSALFLKEAADSEEFETHACMLLLADYYHRSADSTQRRYWLQKAAELGSVEAEKLLRLWNILQ